MRMRLGIISDFRNRLVRRLILLRHLVVGFFLLLPGFTLLALGFLLYATRLFDFAPISVTEMCYDVIDLLVSFLSNCCEGVVTCSIMPTRRSATLW